MASCSKAKGSSYCHPISNTPHQHVSLGEASVRSMNQNMKSTRYRTCSHKLLLCQWRGDYHKGSAEQPCLIQLPSPFRWTRCQLAECSLSPDIFLWKAHSFLIQPVSTSYPAATTCSMLCLKENHPLLNHSPHLPEHHGLCNLPPALRQRWLMLMSLEQDCGSGR